MHHQVHFIFDKNKRHEQKFKVISTLSVLA